MLTSKHLTGFVFLFVCSCLSDDDPVADANSAPVEDFSVEFETSAGTFFVDVTGAWSPKGAARFGELVDQEFYDGCRFFRVLPGFVVQLGINGTPSIQSQWSDNTIADDPVVSSNTRGFVTFAKSNAPNSRTTQFFINYGDNSFLDNMGFSPFATIRDGGMAAVDTINAEYEEAPQQSLIEAMGNSYLDSNYPNLDHVISARRVTTP